MNQAGDAPLAGPAARRWDFIAGLMNELGLKTAVEVGCKEGRLTGFILANVPNSSVIAIDPWIADPAPENGDRTRENYRDWNFEEIEQEFWKNIGENRGRVTMLREKSLDVAAHIGGEFDLVFIDALHDHESVRRDIEAWFTLVRPGGVIAGHDFNHKWPGVERAVADCFSLMDIGLGPDSVWFAIKGDSHAHGSAGAVQRHPDAA